MMSETGIKTSSIPLKWTLDTQMAFETLKRELQTAPIPAKPDYIKPLICMFQTDVINMKLLHSRIEVVGGKNNQESKRLGNSIG